MRWKQSTPEEVKRIILFLNEAKSRIDGLGNDDPLIEAADLVEQAVTVLLWEYAEQNETDHQPAPASN